MGLHVGSGEPSVVLSSSGHCAPSLRCSRHLTASTVSLTCDSCSGQRWDRSTVNPLSLPSVTFIGTLIILQSCSLFQSRVLMVLTPVHTISEIHRCSGVPDYYIDSGSKSYLDFIDSEVCSLRLSKLSRVSFLSMAVSVNCLLTSKWQKNYKICYKHCPIKGRKAVEGGSLVSTRGISQTHHSPATAQG